MALRLRTRAESRSDTPRFTAKLTFEPIADPTRRKDFAFVATGPLSVTELEGYAAIVTTPQENLDQLIASASTVVQVSSLNHFQPGHIVSIEPRSGMILTIFRPESRHNVIFTTERCNSNCLMCSQPPKDVDDNWRFDEHLRLLSLIDEDPQFLCITGGEPTLMGDNLIRLVAEIGSRLPSTNLQMLTNGRTYRDAGYVAKLAAVGHPSFISAIPLYADIAGIHDYIVQSPGAFDQTIEGIYNAADYGLPVEIRVVLHKQSVPRLRQLAEFIYRNFPFAAHVTFMGMEHMGYVKKNWETLWIDPIDYMPALEAAVEILWQRRMNVSIYNLQLCLLPKSLWQVGRKSISDFKNEYIEECGKCSVREHCAGLFTSQVGRYSRHLHSL